jgi:RNA polymerase sigma factor (sigma-70 family)
MRNPLLSSAELSQLWKKHSAALLLIARGHCGGTGNDCDDCVQEAFIKLATQNPIPDDPVAWLARVVRNSAIDAIRSNQRRVDREAEAMALRPVWLEPVDPSAVDNPSPGEIQDALAILEDVTRDIVVAHIWNQMTFRQIAEAFELSPATTHRKYEAGIEALRNFMTTQKESNNHER